ncbi:MAG TPA: YoaK family protein [Pseudobdellovibrionaceae bacterium]|nr:YoaK family protein [Pseudobdellovibrionaceae bacterium]
MFSELNYSHYSRPSVVVWLSMAFQAGAINTGGYLACHRFVSHTTGFATLFGESLAEGKVSQAMSLISVPFFFLIGAMISAIFVDKQKAEGKTPLYVIVFFLMSLFLLLVLFVGVRGGFGTFGAAENEWQNYNLMALLCLTSGMQNATVTTAFRSVIRTTHLTGLTTDLGIGIVRMIFANHLNVSRDEERKANWMRTGIITFFVLGALTSSLIYLRSQYVGFLLPFIVSLGLFIYTLRNFLDKKLFKV